MEYSRIKHNSRRSFIKNVLECSKKTFRRFYQKFIIKFTGKMEALIDSMVMFYKESLERQAELLEMYRQNFENLKLELVAAKMEVEHVEAWNERLEGIMDAQTDLLERIFNQSTIGEREELMLLMNIVERDHNVQFDIDNLEL